MDNTKTLRVKTPVALLPAVLGFLGLIISVIYQSQRAGVFLGPVHRFDRFIQHHLDAIAASSSLCAALGVLVGLVILSVRARSPIVVLSMIFSLAVLLWSMFGLSL
jgi:hypothetical protein